MSWKSIVWLTILKTFDKDSGGVFVHFAETMLVPNRLGRMDSGVFVTGDKRDINGLKIGMTLPFSQPQHLSVRFCSLTSTWVFHQSQWFSVIDGRCNFRWRK